MNQEIGFGTGHLPADPAALMRGLQTFGASIAQSGGLPILRLLKSGRFVYGPDDTDLQEGSHWALNPASLQHGWACWIDSELLGEVMVPFTVPVPLPETLADYGDKDAWKPQIYTELKCLNGEDAGMTVRYKSTALGMRGEIKKVIAAMIGQLAVDKEFYVPVIEFDVDSYNHKKHGETFKPVMDVVDWLSVKTGQRASGGDATQPAQVAATLAAPVATTAAPVATAVATPAVAAVPAGAPAPEAPPATTRRRRRAV